MHPAWRTLDRAVGRWISVTVLAGGLGLAACIDPESFLCTDSGQCRVGEGGRCESNGKCTHLDDGDRCESGRVWSRTAGSLAGQCYEADSDGTTTQTSADDVADVAESGGTDTSTGDADTEATAGGTETGPAAGCGNGELDPGESCDDDNLVDGDGCNADCMPSGRALWTYTPSASDFDNTLGAVALAENGDVLAVGYSGAEAAQDQFDSDQYELLFVRADDQGRPLEIVTESRPGRDQLRCVFVAPDGAIWVGGERNDGGARLWLGEVVDGAFVEGLDYGAFEPEQTAAQDCAVRPDGRVVVVGQIEGTDSGEGFESWDRLVLRDALGPDRSALALPGAGELRDLAYAIVPLPDDHLLVAGTTSPDPPAAGTFSQRWVQRFDADDADVWSYVLGGAGNAQEEVYGLALAGDRSYAVGSEGFGNGDAEREWIGVLGLEGGVVDYDGDVLDDGVLPTPARFSDVAVYPDGDVIAVGRAGETGELVAVAVRLDPSATSIRWIGTEYGVSRIAGVAVTEDGAAVVVGSTHERGEDGPAWIARLAP